MKHTKKAKGLRCAVKNGVRYWSVVDPRTDKVLQSFGTDQALAEAFARDRAEHALAQRDEETRQHIGAKHLVRDLTEPFRHEYHNRISTRPISKATLKHYDLHTRYIEQGMGHLRVSDVRTKHCREFLNSFIDRPGTRKRMTDHLHRFFAFAIEQCDLDCGNPVLSLRDKTQAPPTKRSRLTHEQFLAIRAHATVSLRNAMDLGLESLQAVNELTKMKFSDRVEYRGKDCIHVVRQKTAMRSAGGNNRIVIWPQLAAIIDRCAETAEGSEYLIHHLPTARRNLRGKRWCNSRISSGFAKARDACGAFVGVPVGELPTFHEIRSLGARMKFEEQGWTEGELQLVLGHASIITTQNYLRDHKLSKAAPRLVEIARALAPAKSAPTLTIVQGRRRSG